MLVVVDPRSVLKPLRALLALYRVRNVNAVHRQCHTRARSPVHYERGSALGPAAATGLRITALPHGRSHTALGNAAARS
jgi:hypothetical protein